MHNQLRQQAKQLKQAKNFEEALPLFKQLWEEHRKNCNEWDGWNYAHCLSKQKDYKNALKICREVYEIKKNFEQNNELYAWCIYHTEIKIEKVENEQLLFKAGEAIIKLTKQKPTKQQSDSPCVYSLSIFKILDYLNKKTIYNPKQIIYWTEKLNPVFLETVPFKFTDNEGKERELASKKEEWYSLRSKALYENRDFKDCISLSEVALKSLPKFHYDNDIWFKRNIALSKAELGNIETAIEELKSLLKRKNEWFIQKEIAELYKRQKKIDDAVKYAVDAALNYGDPDKKMNLYKLLADLLKIQNKIQEAKTHIELIYKIRLENQWKIDLELLDLVNSYNIDKNNIHTAKELIRDLKKIWETLKFGDQEVLRGIIKTIISEGKAGFVETEDKKLFYFSTKDFKGKQHLIKEGLKVSFFLKDSFDKKKNQPTKNAVNIKPIFNYDDK